MPRLWAFLTAALVLAVITNASARDQRGTASWYGRDHHGRQMANGRRFDMRAATIAHRTLPLGSVVTVRNLENGRTVRATVTDRGPYARGRVADLSRGLAKSLGFLRQGVAPVEIRLVSYPDQPVKRHRT